MHLKNLASLLLLPAAIRAAVLNSTSTTACNNSPNLCSKAYNEVTYLGAHDSPFLRDASTDYSTSGNQYYNTTVQLSAGVRLLTAQVQTPDSSTALHVCHTSCDLLDAGSLSDWLGEVRSWMDSNPNEVVTVLIVNGASASASDLAAAYQAAGLTNLAYTPTGSTSQTQDWPTLQSLITSGRRLVNFVDSLDDNSGAPYLMHQYDYIFQNNYDVSTPSEFSCEANAPSTDTAGLISNDMMPLMNHFLYHVDTGFIKIDSPNSSYVGTTNAPSGGIGNLGSTANTCKQYYGRAPSYIVVDFLQRWASNCNS